MKTLALIFLCASLSFAQKSMLVKYRWGEQAPSAPTLNVPADGRTGVGIDTLIAWYDVSGETKYHTQLDTVNTFTGTLKLNDSTLAANTTNDSTKTLDSNETYYWRVRAGNDVGWSSWSSTRSFTTVSASSGIQIIDGQTTGNYANGGTLDLTMPGNVTSGNSVIIGYTSVNWSSGDAPAAPVVTKGSGTATIGTPVIDGEKTSAINDDDGRISIIRIPITGSGSLVINIANDIEYAVAGACEFSGIATSNPKDGSTVTNTATSTSESTGDVTLSQTGMIFAIFSEATSSAITYTAHSDSLVYSNGAGNNNQTGIVQCKTASAGTYNITATYSGTTYRWDAVAVAYKAQ